MRHPTDLNQRSLASPATASRGSGKDGVSLLCGAGRQARLTGWADIMMLSSSLPAVAETNAATVIPGWLTQPMSLTDALTIALLRNSSIVRARSDLEAARGIAIRTRAVALPKLRGSSDYTHTEAVEEFP